VPRSRAARAAAVRVVLDEDIPEPLADHIRARGHECVTVGELRRERPEWRGKDRVSDDDVCREVGRIPSVLVTLNVRDYADRAFIEKLVSDYGVSVVIVRPPKSEARAGERPRAIHDIVHRHAHKLAGLYGGEPVVVSANRTGFRRRSLSEIPTLDTR
jgi:hypothetical protein